MFTILKFIRDGLIPGKINNVPGQRGLNVSFYVSKYDFSGIGYKYRVSTTNR
jgi:hypothetical protein